MTAGTRDYVFRLRGDNDQLIQAHERAAQAADRHADKLGTLVRQQGAAKTSNDAFSAGLQRTAEITERAARVMAAAAGTPTVLGTPGEGERLAALANIRQAAFAKERADYERQQSVIEGIKSAGLRSQNERDQAAFNAQAAERARQVEAVRGAATQAEYTAAVNAGTVSDLRAERAKQQAAAGDRERTAGLARSAAAQAEYTAAVNAGTVSDLQSARAQQQRQTAFLQTLRTQVAAAEAVQEARLPGGKGARAALLEIQAAQVGATSAAAPLIARLGQLDKQAQGFNTTGKLTVMQLQQVGFQLNDLAVQVASGGGLLIPLIQQGSQLSGTFGGIRPALSAVLSLVTPARVAIGGAAAGVGLLATAYLQGYRESRAFNDAVVLTGNYAGRTAGEVDRMAVSIAKLSDRPIGAVRDALQATVSSGRFGPENIERVGTAVASLQRFSGQAADEIVKNLSRIADDPAKAAIELNRQYNFLTPQVYAQVKALQEQGRQTEAVGVVVDALNGKFLNQQQRLSGLEQAYKSATVTASSFWNALKFQVSDALAAVGVGENTLEKNIERISGRLEDVRKIRQGGQFFVPLLGESFSAEKQIAEYEGVLAKLRESKKLNDDTAKAVGDNARVRQEALDAGVKVDAITRSTENNQQKLNRSLSEYRIELGKIRKENPNDERLKPENVARVEAGLRKQFADKPDRRGAGEARGLRKAELDDELRELQDANQRERDDLQGHQQLLDAQYRAGELSLAEYYQRRDAEQDAFAARLRTRNEEELELLAGFQDDALRAGDRVQAANADKQITASLGQQARVEEANAQRRRLDGYQYTEQLRQQAQQLAEFNAAVVALTGDERELARVRIDAQVADARRVQRQAGAGNEDQIARYRQLLEAQEGLRRAQEQAQLVNAAAATEEERYLQQAEQRGATLSEIDAALYERRRQQLEQLRLLTAAAEEYARVSGDPRAAQQAAEMGVAYQRAMREIDPAINRLRSGLQGLADGTADNIGRALGQARTAKEAVTDIFNSVLEDTKRFLIELTIIGPLKQNLRGLVEQSIGGLAQGFGVGAAANAGRGGLAIDAAGIGIGAAQPTVERDTLRRMEASVALPARTAVDATGATATSSVTALASAADLAAAALERVASAAGAPATGPVPPSLRGVFNAFDVNGIGPGSEQPTVERDLLRRMEAGGTAGDATAGATSELQTALGGTTQAAYQCGQVLVDAALGAARLKDTSSAAAIALQYMPQIINTIITAAATAGSGSGGGGGGIGGFIASLFGGGGSSGGTFVNEAGGTELAGSLGFAKGGVFGGSNNVVTPFAKGGTFTNKIFSEPTPFRFARGGVMERGVMGEAGDEAVMPLQRDASGRLGVGVVGAGGGAQARAAAMEVNVNIIGGPPDAPKVNKRQRPDGGFDLNVVYGQMRDRMGAEIDSGTGLADNISGRFGMNKAAALTM